MKQLKLIGVCLSTINEEDRFNFICGLNKYAVLSGYRLLIFNSCADLYEQSTANNEGSSAVFRLIPYDKLSALILFPNIMYDTGIVDEVVRNCHEHGVPIISIDKEMPGCISFAFSNTDIFEKLCRHVIEDHGARKLFMIAGFRNNVYSEERIAAFRIALEKNDIKFEPNNIGYGCFWEQPTLEILKKWFIEEKRDIPDAIICANDFMAITASGFLQEMGVKIPEDCIITGFDGIKQTEYLPPNITTCKQDFDKMGRMITDTILKLDRGEKISGSFIVNFNIIYSQSCGCAGANSKNINNSVRALMSELSLSDERQKMVCSAQDTVPRIADIDFLPRMLMDKFRFDTCIFALNENIFSPPDFGNCYKGDLCFSKQIDILFHRYNNTEYEQCKIPLSKLIPRYDLMMEKTDPIIVCCSNFTDMVMGYCVFQPETSTSEYDKMHSIMSTIGSALGNFHSRMQIRSMNKELIAANSELRKLSQRDFMTGLFNRRGFFDKLSRSLSDKKSYGNTLIIISADLDGLKYINDNFGHTEGDNAIITVGKALLSSSLHSEICARFGGDEFCVAAIIDNRNSDIFFKDFQKRFLDFLNDYNCKSGKPYIVRASIGYNAETITDKINTLELINTADENMYNYKIKNKANR